MKACDIWIFHVGRGIAGAIRTPSGKWIAIDLGNSEDFCPVDDFYLRKIKKTGNEKGDIAQLIISHPHNDHMSSIKKFGDNFYPSLLTVPNDNDPQDKKYKINWERIKNPNEELTNYLRKKMLPGRTPPLKATRESTKGFNFEIHHLAPEICENDEAIATANYPNNISILARLNYKGNVVLFSGDMMKDGMKKIIETTSFGQRLKHAGVSFLVVPHHGLRSSFSVDLFNAMKGGKPALNIISEKPTKSDSNEIVDTRYGDPDYANGHKVIIGGKSVQKRKLRTSAVGHIHIRLFEDGRRLVTTGDKVIL